MAQNIDWEAFDEWKEGIEETLDEERIRREEAARKLIIYLGVPLILRGLVK